MAGNRYIAPSSNEVEISIFGPGVGECIVLHLGDGEWMIVDSCIDRKTNDPIALQYLSKLGLNVGSAVKCFVVTHWHDDHINGAAKILSACPSAQFVCSAALRDIEFLEFVNLYSKRALMVSSGVDEFARIFEELSQRLPRRTRRISVAPTWALADRRLLYLPKYNRSNHAEVYALSPSDAAISLAISEISQLIKFSSLPKRRAVAQSPNHVSVALWVVIENIHIILGSDLEHRLDQRLGWQAVINSPARPRGSAFMIKVPHHGSSNAYCQDVWTKLLTSDPIAVITPFSSCSKPLPSKNDLLRIRRHTSNIYCTSDPLGYHPPRRDSTVDKMLKEIVKTRRVIQGPMGHVRVRLSLKNSHATPNIDMFDGAKRIV